MSAIGIEERTFVKVDLCRLVEYLVIRKFPFSPVFRQGRFMQVASSCDSLHRNFDDLHPGEVHLMLKPKVYLGGCVHI